MKISTAKQILFFFVIDIISSVFGQTEWTTRSSGTLKNLRSIVWTGEKLVTVGDSGVILTSEDGVAWENCSSGVNKDLLSITWTGEKLIAVGDSGMVCSSDDGIFWGKKPMIRTFDLISVVWAKDKIWLLAVTPQQVTDTILYVSNDGGMQWTSLPLLSNMGYYVSLSNNDSIFVVVGGVGGGTISSSPDGITWDRRLGVTNTDFQSVAWAGNKFVAVADAWLGQADVYVSDDGISWDQVNSLVAHGLYYITYQNNIIITVGRSGTILTSTDAETWTPQTSGTSRELRCVTFTGKQFVAVGDSGTILTSPAENVPVVRSSRKPGFHELTIKSTPNLLIVELPLSLRGSSVCIYSLAGKKILESRDVKAAGKFTISTGNLAPGVYQLAIEHKGRKLARSFVVNR